MCSVAGFRRSSLPAKVVMLGAAGLLIGGCSSEMTRFGGSTFGETQYTGSVSPVPSESVAGGAMGAGDPRAGAAYSAVMAQPLEPPAGGQQFGAQHYGSPATGGRTVTVQNGDTVYSLSRRYGVPADALMRANNLSDPTAVHPGQQLTVPVYSNASGSWQAQAQAQAQAPAQAPAGGQQGLGQPQQWSATPQPAPQAQPQQAQAAPRQQGGAHTVRSGETVYSIARSYDVRPGDIVSANGLSSPDQIRVGQRLSIPGGSGGQMAASPVPAQQPAPAQAADRPQAAPAPIATQPPRSNTVETAQPTPAALTPGDSGGAGSGAAAGLPEPAAMAAGKFRWPVRGRVIAGFGDSAAGGRNDGINISVPEGTSVRAAENGVVAYAGNELKGYGNLILIRHSDDWVSAYAHNKDLAVSRGDTVTRGQVIATAGQTGSVSSPQLHFELRRGSQPVDPLQYLAEN